MPLRVRRPPLRKVPRQVYRPPHPIMRKSTSARARSSPTVPMAPSPLHGAREISRDPFLNYSRVLTPEGGILILYRDQNCGLLVTILRVIAWIVAVGLGGWLVFYVSALSALQSLLAFALLMFVTWLILRLPVPASHSVEIRPDAMIVDGEDVFYAEDIGDNWPELQVKDGDPERMVISGICGTRFIEYMTVNRLDECDRTAEVLAADLKAAMEQMWGRREVTFPAAF